MGKSHSYDEDFIIDKAIYGSENITLEAEDDEFFRIDVYDGMDNLPMFWQYPSIQAFHSIVPESVMTMYPELGIERGVASRPEPEHYALRTLTSCKYLFIESNRSDTEVCYGFEKIDAQNGFDIYQNEYYVPMGWVYEQYCTSDDYESTAEDYRARLMLKAICLSDEQVEKYGQYMTQYNRPDTFLSEYDMKEDTDKLRETCADSFVVTQSGFKSEITLASDNLVFYSVPYDDGWKAYVNGKEVEVERVNSGFVAVLAPAGENVIEFKYTTPGLFLGIIISAVSLVILLAYLLIVHLYRKKHPRVERENDQIFNELKEMLDAQSEGAVSFTIHAQTEPEIQPLRFEPEAEENTLEAQIQQTKEQEENPKGEEEN